MTPADTTQAKTVAPASGLRRVTAVRAMVDAQAIDAVCCADRVVAIHCATATGIVVVLVPVDEFVSKCRAARDHHGRPFPLTTRRETVRAEIAADAQATADAAANRAAAVAAAPAALPRPELPAEVLALPPVMLRTSRPPSSETIETLRSAWRLWVADGSIPKARLAAHLGVSDVTLTKWFARFSREPGAPVLKPNGRI